MVRASLFMQMEALIRASLTEMLWMVRAYSLGLLAMYTKETSEKVKWMGKENFLMPAATSSRAISNETYLKRKNSSSTPLMTSSNNRQSWTDWVRFVGSMQLKLSSASKKWRLLRWAKCLINKLTRWTKQVKILKSLAMKAKAVWTNSVDPREICKMIPFNDLLA